MELVDWAVAEGAAFLRLSQGNKLSLVAAACLIYADRRRRTIEEPVFGRETVAFGLEGANWHNGVMHMPD